jgi:hypothetical protein
MCQDNGNYTSIDTLLSNLLTLSGYTRTRNITLHEREAAGVTKNLGTAAWSPGFRVIRRSRLPRIRKSIKQDVNLIYEPLKRVIKRTP